MRGNGRTRLISAMIAIMAWSAEVLFVAEQVARGGSLGQVLWKTFAYLTDWSASGVAVVCTLIALRGTETVSPFWRTAATMGTVTVGVLFAGIGGLAVIFDQGASSVLAHLAVPVAMALSWLLLLPHAGLRWGHAPRLAALMVLYLAVMFARGALTGFYPYRFMNPGEIGSGPALAFAGVMTVTALAVAFALVAIDRRRARADEGR